MTAEEGRLVILSGPSCVGKSPLDKALTTFYPELRQQLRPLVLYNSRDPRPGEKDGVAYHFRTRGEIEALRVKDNFVVIEVRGDLQALDLDELASELTKGDVFFEGNPFVGRLLQTHEKMKSVRRLSVFMAPLSKDEILYLRDPEKKVSLQDFVTDVMRRKLFRRTQKQKGELARADVEEIERRAGSAFKELGEAHHFDYVIVNHDGEDSDNWDAFYYPIGDARKALRAFAILLKGETPPGVKKWEADLLH